MSHGSAIVVGVENDREHANYEDAEQLTKKLPSLVDRRTAHALIEKTYDESTMIELDPDATAPFVREPVNVIDGYERYVDGAQDSDAPDLTGYTIKNA